MIVSPDEDIITLLKNGDLVHQAANFPFYYKWTWEKNLSLWNFEELGSEI